MSATATAPAPPLNCELRLARAEQRLAAAQRELREAAEMFAPHQKQIEGARRLAEQAYVFFESAEFDANLSDVQAMLARRELAQIILEREAPHRAEYAEARRRLLAQEALAQRDLDNFRDNEFPALKEQQERERAAEARRLKPQQILIDELRPNERIHVLADGSQQIVLAAEPDIPVH